MNIFNQQISIHESMSQEEINQAIDFAMWLGFHSVEANFPIASREGNLVVPSSRKEWEKYRIQVDSLDKEDHVPSQAPSDFEIPLEHFGLDNLFLPGKVLIDSNRDFLPEQVDLKIQLPQSPTASMVIAACNIAFRLGMETTSYSGSLVGEDNSSSNVLEFVGGQKASLSLDPSEHNMLGKNSRFRSILSGDGEDLEELSAQLCNRFPLGKEGGNLRDFAHEMAAIFERKSFDGQLAMMKNKTGKAYFSNTQRPIEPIQKQFPQMDIVFYKTEKEVLKKSYDLPWEVHVMEQVLEEFYTKIQPKDQLSLQVCVSEDKQVRSKIKAKIQERLKQLDAAGEVQVICSYKQGFSWIEEEVIPSILSAMKSHNISQNQLKLKILFKAFLPEGVSTWEEESGAIPTYGANKSMEGKWLDLPIRFMQELYPIVDILEKVLGISKDVIAFDYSQEEETYQFYAMADNEVFFEDRYDAKVEENLYLYEYPQMGLVHPPTGYVRGRINEGELWEQRIETDLEGIWRIYQEDVLPTIKSHVLEKAVQGEKPPYFAKAELNIEVSEPNERLDSREDLISSLDALHEDIYFTTLEYLKCVGIEHQIPVDGPGLVLPNIVAREGKPKFELTLYDHQGKMPYYEEGDKNLPMIADQKAEVMVEEVYWNEGLVLALRVQGVERELLESYQELVQSGIGPIKMNYYKGLEIRFGDEKLFFDLVAKKEEKSLSIQEVNIMENQLIGYDEYLQIMEQLKKVQGITVHRLGESFQGRTIYCVLLEEEPTGYRSMTKRLSLQPSLLINARHHANEVSSTNGAFMLMNELLTNKKYTNLSQKMVLGIIPMENVDGSAIHYELQKDNPTWSLHTARFNALGLEFIRDSFQKETIHTESLAMSDLWQRILPDIFVDNHGVPSHEWAQPFSGYTAPAYKGFWLPRSLIYGYFWWVDDPRYLQNKALNQQMEEVIADAFGKDEEITVHNKEWIWQFENYAHQWMPKQYPAHYYKDMINYWIPFGYDANHKYTSIRLPWITAVSYTSEVADETAQGEYLGLCARTHMVHDLATIDLLLSSQSVFVQHFSGEKQEACQFRQRPLCFT